MKTITKLLPLVATVFLSSAVLNVEAKSYSADKSFKVTVTNLTKGMSFTPILVATHDKYVNLFSLGNEASASLARVAEGGDIGPLNNELSESNHVHSTNSSAGLLTPGSSVTIDIDSSRPFKGLSLVSMLLPTNDTIVALRAGKLPRNGKVTYLLKAYDAGTETNDEACANIPGPHCGGSPFSPEDSGEGYVYPSPSIHGEGELSKQLYQWDGVVAKVVIEAQ